MKILLTGILYILEEVTHFSNAEIRTKNNKMHEERGKHAQRMTCLETYLKELEICGLPAKKFTTIILKMLEVLLENTDRQLNEIWETMHG